MLKTHLTKGCGRGQRVTDNVFSVNCALCQSTDVFVKAKADADAKRHAAFLAQEPRVIGEPWRDGRIVCSQCNGDLFRVGDRTCMGHYDNFHCGSCGHVESRLTETGMCF